MTLRPVRTLILAACLTLSVAGGSLSLAAEDPREKPAPPEGLPKEETVAPGSVMDKTHAYLERNILERVIWFDEFFGSVKTEQVRKPEYLLRWQSSLQWAEGGQYRFRTSIRANVRLPKISKRLHLVITGESEADPIPKLPEDPGNPGFDRTLAKTRLVNTELRYGLLQRPDIDLFIGAGVRLVLPVETFVRSRFQYIRHLGDVSLARFGETVFWKSTDGFGETTEIALERKLGPKTLLRWANSGTVSQISKGLEWGTELSLLQQISPRSAISLTGGVFGDTRPVTVVETYTVSSRYRRNFLRKWLFFELEPAVSWLRDPMGGFPPSYAFTFRIEVVFEGGTPQAR